MIKIPVAENLFLTELELDDAKSLALHLNNRLIYRNTLTIPYPYLEKNATEFIQYQLNLKNSEIEYPKILGIRFENEIIGTLGLITKLEAHFDHQAEIGYWISEDFWNKGIMTKCVNKFISYCFENFHIRKIFAHVFEINKASIKVLEKNNFTLEGFLREVIRKDGKFMNCYYMGLLKTEHTKINYNKENNG